MPFAANMREKVVFRKVNFPLKQQKRKNVKEAQQNNQMKIA